jgi:ADP-ribose pyrophosphatase YjhB (NUDIX family)
MHESARAARETQRVLAELVAEHGRVEVIGRRWECRPEVRDRVAGNLERTGAFGGAGALVSRVDGTKLLVRYGDGEGWSDPGLSRHPGEGFAECAARAVRETTGLRVRVGSVAQAHVLYADDWTDRDPVAHPFVLFEAERRDGDARPRGEVVETGWFSEPPGRLRYEELRELF